MSEGEIAAREAAECVAALAKRLIENVETVVTGTRQVITEAAEVATLERLRVRHPVDDLPEARLRRQASADVISTILARVPPPTAKAPT